MNNKLEKIPFQYNESYMVKIDSALLLNAFKEGVEWLYFLDKVFDDLLILIDNYDKDMEMDIVDYILDNENLFTRENLIALIIQPIDLTDELSAINRAFSPSRDIINKGEELHNEIIDILNNSILNYSLPTMMEIKNLKEFLYEYLGLLSYFLYHQYDLEKIKLNYISEPVFYYLDGNKSLAEELMNNIFKLTEKYPIQADKY